MSLKFAMAEETLLPVELEKLEIERNRHIVLSSDENPFKKRSNYTILPKRCASLRASQTRKLRLLRKSNFKIKSPVLEVIATCCQYSNSFQTSLGTVQHSRVCETSSETINYKNTSPKFSKKLDVDIITDTCNQLSLSSYNEINNIPKAVSVLSNQNANVGTSTSANFDRFRGNSSSCSQQALNPSCDVTIDELASYFETMVHIPKKMSSMAEMMYN